MALIRLFRNEYHYFLAAIQFLTRIQVPASFQFKPEMLQHSTRYFPLVGNLVAAISLLFYLIVSKYLSEDLGILGYMLSSIWITGAFHEDGWADSCDGFGGGYTKEKILSIMKDSRLGTYGTVGLMAMLSLKFLLLKELPAFNPPSLNASLNPLINYKQFILICLAAHGISRLMGVTIIQQYQYVTDPDQSKSKPVSTARLNMPAMVFAIVLACWPLLLLSPWYLLCTIPVFLVRTAMGNYFRVWIGGYTGDCLGAVQQVTEIIFYLSALILWRYFL